jgi:hypothetical protein
MQWGCRRICSDIEAVLLLDDGFATSGSERCLVGLSGLHNSWGITFGVRSTDPVGRCCSHTGPRRAGGFSYPHKLHEGRRLEDENARLMDVKPGSARADYACKD